MSNFEGQQIRDREETIGLIEGAWKQIHITGDAFPFEVQRKLEALVGEAMKLAQVSGTAQPGDVNWPHRYPDIVG